MKIESMRLREDLEELENRRRNVNLIKGEWGIYIKIIIIKNTNDRCITTARAMSRCNATAQIRFVLKSLT